MFYCYVLNSRKTGRRYVGSCEDLNARVDRHNAGKVKATRHGVPWIIVHNEAFSTRCEAAGREHYYKTGRGRDELDAVVGRSPRRLTPTKRRVKMKLSLSILLVAVFGSAFFVRGQEAADADLQMREKSNATPRAAETISPTAKVPELSEIDEVFKRTSLGKEADERRLHIEWRQLSNRVVNNPDIMAARKSAESARTELEKRQRLRDYYEIYYGRMRALASSAEMKAALDQLKLAHLSQTSQPRVRPGTDAALPTPTPARKRRKNNKF